MLTIALTSIPPRFGLLQPVLASLLAQTVPVRVVLNLPPAFRRFPGPVAVPDLPEQVVLHRTETDYGPATKLLGALEQGHGGPVLYCDDDCLYAADWAEQFLKRHKPGVAVAASVFPVSRLRRSGADGFDLIAQGFAGVLVDPGMFDADIFDLSPAAFGADDIWISGQLARRNVPIVATHAARAACQPLPSMPDQLQDQQIAGLSRKNIYAACLDDLHSRYGIWPNR